LGARFFAAVPALTLDIVPKMEVRLSVVENDLLKLRV
jgi:hypothetical protein